MVTQDGNNVGVVAVEGNFDDAQTGVKKIFSSVQMREVLAKEKSQVIFGQFDQLGALGAANRLLFQRLSVVMRNREAPLRRPGEFCCADR